MTYEELIEIMAKAMYTETQPDVPWETTDEIEREAWTHIAQAGLSAVAARAVQINIDRVLGRR